MKKPTDNIEKQFNDNGIFFLDKLSINEFEGNYISLDCDIVIMTEQELTVPDFSVSIVNKREVSTLFTDWKLVEQNEQKVLTFKINQRLPSYFDSYNESHLNYMSFLDLCFYAGNEAIPETYGDDIVTKPREGYKPKDLGWILRSRFIDAIIPSIGKVDDFMLAGNASQALLYGPFYIGEFKSEN